MSEARPDSGPHHGNEAKLTVSELPRWVRLEIARAALRMVRCVEAQDLVVADQAARRVRRLHLVLLLAEAERRGEPEIALALAILHRHHLQHRERAA
jgi:hypothetical protein